MHEIFDNDGKVVARIIQEKDWNYGLRFFSDGTDFLQVGTWRYNKEEKLAAHIHNEVKREINRTHEILYIRKGLLEVTFYDIKAQVLSVNYVYEGETLVVMNCGHGYKILEDNTQVIEIKNGPYLGPEIDRTRI